MNKQTLNKRVFLWGGSVLLEQVSCYIIAILTCVCFLIFVLADKNHSIGKIYRYFVAGTLAVLAVIVSEIVETAFAQPNCTYVTWQRWAASIAAYILRPGIAFILLLIPLRNAKQKIVCFAALPLVVDAIFLLLSPFCGIVFTFSDSNNYAGGPLKYLPFFAGGIYLAGLLLSGIIRAWKHDISEAVVVLFIVVMSCMAVYLESSLSMLGSLPNACIISMLFYYVYFYMDCYSRDSLTGAYQRNRFYHDVRRNVPRYFIMFDVNGLKRINDGFGHMFGDAALSSLGKTIRYALPRRADLYRIGGDEFAVLYSDAEECDVNQLLQEIVKNLDAAMLPYGISYGFSSFDKADGFNDAYQIADKMLYENKDRFWQKYRRSNGRDETVSSPKTVIGGAVCSQR